MRIHRLSVSFQTRLQFRQISLFEIGAKVKLGHSQFYRFPGVLGGKASTSVDDQGQVNCVVNPG
jgi:hypothetical protein